MLPEKVVEAQHDAGDGCTDNRPAANGHGPNVGADGAGSTALVPNNSQPSSPPVLSSAASAAADMLVERYPDLYTEAMRSLSEDRDKAMRMHNHYASVAVNMEAQAVETDSDQLARDYLETAVRVDTVRAELVKSIANNLLKAPRAGRAQQSAPQQQTAVQVQQGGVAIFGGMSRRDVLQALKQEAGSSSDDHHQPPKDEEK